jgi:hypothetical protein
MELPKMAAKILKYNSGFPLLILMEYIILQHNNLVFVVARIFIFLGINLNNAKPFQILSSK